MPEQDLHVNKLSTPFPMEGRLLEETQEKYFTQWQAMDIYNTILEERRDAELFILHDGPPFTSGEMNVGLGFNKILKDIVVKFQTMNGRKVPFVPGWDCHGLPVEASVQDRATRQHQKLNPLDIRKQCASSVNIFIKEQKKQFQRLGVFADWDRPYLTMQPIYEASVLEVLSEVVSKGYIYRDNHPINWCSQCQVLADAEVETVNGTSLCKYCENHVEKKDMQQWFVNLDHKESGHDQTLRQRALAELDLIKWFPPQSKIRIQNMLKERPDWCISRQRTFGTPIPAICCQECGKDILTSAIIKTVSGLIAIEGSDTWFSSDASRFIPHGFQCSACGSQRFEKGADILDGWFESSTSWRSALISDYRLDFPSDLCIEGNDQHRGWFQLSILTALMIGKRSPFNKILTHGFVLNSKRRPMSRLHGDCVSLQKAIDEVPADLLRLYFVWNRSVDQDVPFSIPSTLELAQVYRNFRNCFRYLLGNISNYLPKEDHIPLNQLNIIDQWILCKLHRLIDRVTQYYEKNDFKSAIEEIHTFCLNDLNKLYFEICKDLLSNEAKKSTTRRSIQTSMHSILLALAKMLAPVLVYTTEEVWALCPGRLDCPSVHLSLWPKMGSGIMNILSQGRNLIPGSQSEVFTELEEQFEQLLALRNGLQPMLEKMRQEGVLRTMPEAIVTLFSSLQTRFTNEYLLSNATLLKKVLNVSELNIAMYHDNLTPLPSIDGLFFHIEHSLYPQCMRCQRYDKTVGNDEGTPACCSRCIHAIHEQTTPHLEVKPFIVERNTTPSDLAAYLRARGIRKIAILKEDDKYSAYYFHLPSQTVKKTSSLQSLADYIQSHNDNKQHEAVLLGLGEHTDVLFGIGIHQLIHGTPLGGTREFSYRSIGAMIEDLLRLSYGMSVKNAIGKLPHGGGKSAIDTCGLDFKIHRELRRHVYRDFGQFTASLFGRYICAEDMNNTNADTREMLAFCRHVMCLPESVGGSGNPSRFTALVAWVAAKAGWKFLKNSYSLDEVVIAIQGLGNVGQTLVEMLALGEPNIQRILVADTEIDRVDKIKDILKRVGKIDRLEVKSANEMDDNYILHAECDILIPVAVGKVIRAKSEGNKHRNLEKLRCKLIVPVANNVFDDYKAVADYLYQNEIIDVVENNVNWGGATVAASELYGYSEEQVLTWCLKKVHEETLALLTESKIKNVAPWTIIEGRAIENIKATHPIVNEFRKYEFIGDISHNFTNWVKSKWLTNKFSIEPENFSSEVVSLTNNYLSNLIQS